MSVRLALIGGSGLPQADLERAPIRKPIATPFGVPSSAIGTASVGDTQVSFLARHGAGHEIPPHRINHRANLWALKELGVDRVLGTCSVGSLKPVIRPGEFVVPDDYLCLWDVPTVYDDKVVHATPGLDPDMRRAIVAVIRKAGVRVYSRAVYAQTRGPRLETKAEIRLLRAYADVVGMTMASEATLAAELGLAYASVCTVDNFAHGITNVRLAYEGIAKTQEKNAKTLHRLLGVLVRALTKE